MTPRTDRLDRYRQKRTAGATPEPFGAGRAPTTGRLFVFHKHHARNLHWDLRLEWEGALESWAVPKGPSPNPKDKRLAMHVEPHPLDYGEFEGVIPAGQYGGGPSIVWDKGIWIPREDFAEGFEKGKLLFELRGFKVRGVWTLIHTPRAGPNNWLLIKERDAYVDERGTDAYPDDSIYSGLDVDDLPRAEEITAELAERAAEAGAAKRRVRAKDIEVMKATPRERPFTDADWVFELKYDGYRLVAGREDDGESAALISRNGNDLTETFPDVARAVRGLPYDGMVLDGEVVVLDENGVPSFDRLQRRGRLQRRADVARAALELPAVYYAFDLLAFAGLDLRKMPLVERKALLQEMLPSAGPIRYSEHIPERGEEMFEQVTKLGLEGLLAKKADSAYVGARSKLWYKIRTQNSDDFVIVGWTDPKGGRAGFGALMLASYVDGELSYAGSVGTGFDDKTLKEILAKLRPLEMDERTEMVGEVPIGKGNHWVRPKLVAEVSFREITSYGMVRHGVFVRLRTDKKPEECVQQDIVRGAAVDGDESDGDVAMDGNGEMEERVGDVAMGDEEGEEAAPKGRGMAGKAKGGKATKGSKAKKAKATKEALPDPPKVTGDRPVVPFTNLKKVFWPADGYTKGDMIDYYRQIWPWLQPWLDDRPLVLTRFPDGIEGKSFYQKDAPEWTPDWIRTVTVWSDSSERELDYFIAEDPETLLYLANLGTIPLHIWHSRVADIEHPDWCLLDLDPKDAPFTHVVEVALFLHELCGELDLPHYVKTTGSTGLHVLIPLGGQMDYDQSRTLGELLARETVKALPKISTVARAVKSRGGKVYVDFMQNRQGQLVASTYCVRPKSGATVSAPLEWKEVGPKLDLRDYTIKTVPPRMARLEKKGIGDPCLPAISEKPDLLSSLQKLTERTQVRSKK